MLKSLLILVKRVFSCEICEIFNDSFFIEHLQNNHPSILETNTRISPCIIKFNTNLVKLPPSPPPPPFPPMSKNR